MKKSFKKNIIIWSIASFPIIFLIILFYSISLGKMGFMPSFKQLENPKSDLASQIYTEDKESLLPFFYEANRSRTEYNELSPYLVDALVSTEDKRYYKHSGIDFKGLVRVLFKTVISGDKNAGGGSTISQQLAKMLFPRENLENSFQMAIRKFREWVIAVKLEKSYSKEEIIAMYLNQYDFLNLAVGIKSASKVYFNCNPNELNIEQAAMLVGMAKNSSLFNPLRRPDTTLHRRNVVLWQMLKNKKLSKSAYDSLKLLPLGLDYQKVDHKIGTGTYFRMYLQKIMTAKKPSADSELYSEWEQNPLYGWCNKNFKPNGEPYSLYEDGLKIYTTINYKMQKYAEEAVKEHLKNNLQIAFDREKRYRKTAPFSSKLTEAEVNNIMNLSMKRSERYRVLRKNKVPEDSILKIFKIPAEMTVFSWNGEIDTVMTPLDSIRYYKHFLMSGIMSMNPKNGFVKAYVGGINYKHFQYDHVTQAKRQIGSTFKPFLYTLAMQDGFSPCYQIPNVPVTILLPDGKTWTPKSGSRSEYERKMISLRFGLRHSLNNASAWLINQFGPDAVIEIARNMGIKSYIPSVPSICLGVADLTLYEMVGAYSSYANKGVYTKPIFVTRIEDKNGNILSNFTPSRKEAIGETTAYLMIKMLEGVYRRGTAVRLWSPNYEFKIDAEIAAKTGTTQNQSDGWFIGITPKLVTGVWTGAEDRAIHFDGIVLGQGANMALPIWGIYMNKIYNDSTLNIYKTDLFEKPENFNETIDCIDVSGKNNDNNNNTDWNNEDKDEFML